MENVRTRYLLGSIGDVQWKNGRAGELMDAAMKGRLDEIDALGLAGASLSALSAGQAGMFFTVFASRRMLSINDNDGDPVHLWSLQGSALAKARLAHNQTLGEAKSVIYKKLIALGLPKGAHPGWSRRHPVPMGEMPLEQHVHGSSPSMAYPLAVEAARGGMLAEKDFPIWAWMEMLSTDKMSGSIIKAQFGGQSPLEWALAAGLKVDELPKSIFSQVIALSGDGCGIDGLLACLSRGAAKLVGIDEDVQGYNSIVESQMGRLLHIGAGVEGISHAVKIGVNPFALDASGRSALENLFDLDRAGRYVDRAAALLDCADTLETGGRDKMLAMRGKKGSTPLHWAARALCKESVAMLLDLGADPNAKDEDGKTAGHWAAKKYGAKSAPKVGPVIEALTKGGHDWKTLDEKGVSALAALAAKAPLEPLSEALAAHVDAVRIKGDGGKSALEVLAARGGANATALAQKMDMLSELGAVKGADAGAKKKAKSL